MNEVLDDLRMPAEWEPHRAVWLAWPDLDSDFPGKLQAVQWAYTEIVRHLARSECVEILCRTESLGEVAEQMLSSSGISGNFRIHLAPYHRTWLRDSAPTAVWRGGKLVWLRWQFNAWAKYDDFAGDLGVPEAISEISGIELIAAKRPDNEEPLVLEGGAIDSDGQGTLLVTEQCLLSEVQQRNSGLSRECYEKAFREYLGVTKTIWLSSSCEGDDTHGHIDDVARFVAPGKVVLMVAQEGDSDYESSQRNLEMLRLARDSRGRNLEVIPLPFPEARFFHDQGQLLRLPASYANFYIGNTCVLVPTFNDRQDRFVLSLFAELFPEREIVGIHCADFVLGLGTLHCSTQQEPKG